MDILRGLLARLKRGPQGEDDIRGGSQPCGPLTMCDSNLEASQTSSIVALQFYHLRQALFKRQPESLKAAV